ncbi:Acid-sensing ion channel 1C [Araneus ventricosus]|uniref:Acid-sensing ion channel 1C n=1 Tax=Araneus ventricosus TaxID=182803 RepID=A0A4Y2DIA5_ARAVE|nr:Acid-sensing ion channel 1C [Araneus ventricosus]
MLKNSSIYAASRMNSSHFRPIRSVWLLVFAACLIGSICKIYGFYNLYRQYPVVVRLQVIHERNLEFPAVSICNLNRIKKKLTKICPPKRKCRPPSGSHLIVSERSSLSFCKLLPNGTRIQNEKNKSAIKFLIWYFNESEMKRSRKGHQPSDFLVGCSFNGRDCSEARVSYFMNFRFGNCVTFNKGNEDNEPLKVSQTGVDSGLTLKIRLETDRYQPTTHTVGARMIIHDPHAIPSAEEEGFFIGPGYETLVSLRQTVIRRLPAPYKDECLDYRNFASNRDECIRKCIQNQNFKKCGCIDQTLAVMNNLTACDLMNVTESCCLDDALDEMSHNESACNCPLPCSAVYYNEELSRSRLPVDDLASLNLTNDPSPEEPLVENSDLKKKNNKYRQENLTVKIFYSNLDRQVYEQCPQWDIVELLSYLGNEIGLWLGLSITTLFEILEKLIILIKLRM